MIGTLEPDLTVIFSLYSVTFFYYYYYYYNYAEIGKAIEQYIGQNQTTTPSPFILLPQNPPGAHVDNACDRGGGGEVLKKEGGREAPFSGGSCPSKDT